MRVLIRLIVVLIITIIGCIYTRIGAWFQPKDQRLSYKMMRQGVAARNFCRVFNIHVHASTDSKVSPCTLRVSNHLTVLDPMIIASQLDVCFAGKAEIARWPIIGWIAQSYAMLLVNRRTKSHAKTFASQVRERLMENGSVMVFPEGTVGNGTTLLPFKTGAFESLKGWDQGKLQPIFINVTGINDRTVDGKDGRIFISMASDVKRHSFIQQIVHIAGLRRLDIELNIGPYINISGMNRRESSLVAREAINRLS